MKHLAKRIRKGNALVLATVILFAVSIISSGLTTYFYYANIQNSFSNLYSQKHVELQNEFFAKYKILVSNENKTYGADSLLLGSVIEDLTSAGDSYYFVDNEFTNKFEYVSSINNKKTVLYILETTAKNRLFHLEKNIVVLDTSPKTYQVSSEEVYKVNVIR